MTDYSAYEETQGQVVCDDCNRTFLNGLHYRGDFGDPRRLCSDCVRVHDNHPDVQAERAHQQAVECMEDLP